MIFGIISYGVKNSILLIIFYLAVTFVAAQDAISPFTGSTYGYQTEEHTGSTYLWEVFDHLDPDIETGNSNYSFIGTANQASVHIQWLGTGVFFLVVTEFDDTGCINKKAIRIQVGSTSNRAPIAVDDSYETFEETALSGNLLDNDSDPDGDAISVVPSAQTSANSEIIINADGSFSYTPNEGFSGTETFTYQVCDDAEPPLCAEGEVRIAVIKNNAPVTQDAVFVIDKNTSLNQSLASRIFDPDGNKLTFRAQSKTTTNGLVVIEPDGDFTYTPNANFTGSDIFEYEVCDDGTPSRCSQGKVYVIIEDVIIFNREAVNDIAFVFENGTANGQVLHNDIDFEGATVSIPTDSDAVNGSLTMNLDGSYSYQPDIGFTGLDNFYYEACADEQPAGCDNANVTIRILPEEITLSAVILSDDEVETAINTPVRGNVLANDFSPINDVLQINPKTWQGPEHGGLTINEDGTFLYSPEAGFTGNDYFIYEVCGLVSGDCETARVTIRVKAEADPRILAVDDVVHIFSSEQARRNLLDNDIAPAGKVLAINTSPIVSPSKGLVSIGSNGDYTYNPTSTAYPYIDQFVYEVCDQGAYCSRATVFVIVTEEPQQQADVSIVKTGPEMIHPGEVITYEITVSNRGNVTAENVLLDDFLPASILSAEYQLNGTGDFMAWPGQLNLGNLEDGSSLPITIRGTVAGNASDWIKNMASVSSDQYDPDLENNTSMVQTATNRAPVIVVENGLHQIIGCCYDSGLQLNAGNSIGESSLEFLWEPATHLDDATSATPLFTGNTTTVYNLTVTASNGESSSETVKIEVAACPEIVTANQVWVETANEMIMLDASESTGTRLTYSWWAANNEIIISGETTSNPVVSGIGKYYVQITDSLGCTDLDSVSVGLLVQIQAVDDSLNMMVNTSVDINVIENDLPVGGVDPSSVTIISPPEYGVAMVVSDSVITYIPNQYYVGRDNFIYTVCDYFKNCDEATVLVIINDEALFIPNAFSPNGDGYNDLFEIKGIGRYQNASLKIFNRWGNLVYEASNYGAGTGKSGFWDGTANRGFLTGNRQVATGTYFYTLDLDDGNEKFNGFIYLDR